MKTEPIKEDELIRLGTCCSCRRKIGQTGVPILWKVTVERHMLNMPALQRQTGLGMLLGSGSLARVMGPDEGLTIPLMPEPAVMMVCDECACQGVILASVLES